jgi:hypothetical protein
MHIVKLFYSLVERSFSKQGFIHSDLTNRKKHSLVAAQMMISFNNKPLNEINNDYIYKLNDTPIELDDSEVNIEEDENEEEEFNYRHKICSSSSASEPSPFASSSSSSSSSSFSSSSSSSPSTFQTSSNVDDDADLAFALSVADSEPAQFKYVCTRAGRQTRQRL